MVLLCVLGNQVRPDQGRGVTPVTKGDLVLLLAAVTVVLQAVQVWQNRNHRH